MDIPASWSNLQLFRTMIQAAAATSADEQRLRTAMSRYMEVCPLALLLQAANALADFREKELNEHIANN